MKLNIIYNGDALNILKLIPSESIDCVVTSPPYWALRNYNVKGQFGLEPTPEEYVNKLCNIFDEIKRVLKKTGTCWINIGDTYFGGGRNKGNKNPKVRSIQTKAVSKLGDDISGPKGQSKCLAQIPSRFAIEMTVRGWILRNEIIWHKPNCMPSSVKDRFTVDFEKIFFFTKSKRYYFKQQIEAFCQNSDIEYRRALRRDKNYKVKQPYNNNFPKSFNKDGRNKRSVWTIATKPFKGAHFATFPEALVETPIIAGSPRGGAILDPFMGSGTTALVAKKFDRNYIGIELNKKYIKLAEKRLKN
jgi:site-specific DNA-methyltransferase (adenine-specific)